MDTKVEFCEWDIVDYNFSHRIIDFSFGERVSGIVNPLDGEEKLTSDRKSDYNFIINCYCSFVSCLHILYVYFIHCLILSLWSCYSCQRPMWTNYEDVYLFQCTDHLISGTLRSTPLPWLPVLSNIEPPALRRKAATDKLVEKIVKHDS